MKCLVACSLVLLLAIANGRPSLTKDDSHGLAFLRAFSDSLNENPHVATKDIISLAKEYAEDTNTIVNEVSNQIKSHNDNQTHIILHTINFVNVAIDRTTKLVENIMGRNLLNLSLNKNVHLSPSTDLTPPLPLTTQLSEDTQGKMKTICSILADLNQKLSLPLVPAASKSPAQSETSNKLIKIPKVTEKNPLSLNLALEAATPFDLKDNLPKVLIPESLSEVPPTILTKSTKSTEHRTNPLASTLESTTTEQITTTNKASIPPSTDSTKTLAKTLIVAPTTTITKTTNDEPIITITHSTHVNKGFDVTKKEILTTNQEKKIPIEIHIAKIEPTQTTQYSTHQSIKKSEAITKGPESVVPYIAVPAVSLNKKEDPGLRMEIVQVPKDADTQTPVSSPLEDLVMVSTSQKKDSEDLVKEVHSTEIQDKKHEAIEVKTIVLNEVTPISLSSVPVAAPPSPKILIPKLAPIPAPTSLPEPVLALETPAVPVPARAPERVIALEIPPVPAAESAQSLEKNLKQVLVAKVEKAVEVDQRVLNNIKVAPILSPELDIQDEQKKELVTHIIVDESPVNRVIEAAIPTLREVNPADSSLGTTIRSEINVSPSEKIDDKSPVIQVVSLTP